MGFPDDVLPERVLFKSNRLIGGVVSPIRYIIHIDPGHYAAIKALDVKKSLGRLVGQINPYLRDTGDKALVMGPGRFGSSNINLGVNVSYADIDNAGVLVEIAREEAGHLPELSYGTHFFQGLVEAQIIYIPVYPDDKKAQFNRVFFERSPSSLQELVPGARGFEDLVRVIDVYSVTDGQYAKVVADPHSQRAICFLDEGSTA